MSIGIGADFLVVMKYVMHSQKWLSIQQKFTVPLEISEVLH